MEMEVVISKKLFLTVDLELPENWTEEDVKKAIKQEIEDHPDLDDWDETDWRGKEVYEAYETYGGCEIELD